jgi:hypothetical protein
VFAVARGEGPYSRTAASSRGSAVSAALENLEGLGVIVRKDRTWAVVDPLFCRVVAKRARLGIIWPPQELTVGMGKVSIDFVSAGSAGKAASASVQIEGAISDV